MSRKASARLSCAAALLAMAGSAAAAGAALGSGSPWGFTLATLDGRRFVRTADIEGPVFVNFWSRDCGPCVEELPRLQEFARANPRWTVLLVSADPPADARAFVDRHGVELQVLRGGAGIAALMRSAGNNRGSLPFTVFLRDGRICDRHLGALSERDLDLSAARCEDGGSAAD